MKKIVLLHFTAPPVVGGVESVLGHHARLMATAGHQLRIIAGRGYGAGDSAEFVHLPLADSLHPEILTAKRHLDDGKIPANFDQLVRKLVTALAEATVDTEVIIAHNVGSLHKNHALSTLKHIATAR